MDKAPLIYEDGLPGAPLMYTVIWKGDNLAPRMAFFGLMASQVIQSNISVQLAQLVF